MCPMQEKESGLVLSDLRLALSLPCEEPMAAIESLLLQAMAEYAYAATQRSETLRRWITGIICFECHEDLV